MSTIEAKYVDISVEMEYLLLLLQLVKFLENNISSF